MFIDRGKSLVHKSGYSFLMQKTSGTLPFWEDSPILKSTFAVASPWGCFKLWTPAVSVRLKQKPRQPGCFSRGVCNGSSVCLQQLSKYQYVCVGGHRIHRWILSTNDLGTFLKNHSNHIRSYPGETHNTPKLCKMLLALHGNAKKNIQQINEWKNTRNIYQHMTKGTLPIFPS